MFLSIDNQFKLFDSVVVPIIIYGCEIWGFSNLTLIETLHLKFAKLFQNWKKKIYILVPARFMGN